MSKLAKALTAAAGNAGESLYVEDVFSTYLYTGGLSSPNVIQTGIDLAGEGGLVWTKNRTSATSNQLTDTVSGYRIESDDTAAGEASQSNVLFNSDGHSLSGYSSFFNGGGDNYASWTFRKAEKFFDVVTYTGDGVTGRAVSHNLGVAPAVIIVKNLSTSNRAWQVYHSSLGITKRLELDSTGAAANSTHWTYEPTSTEFYLRNLGVLNGSGENYVAYLFASDAGGFGDDGSESIIKCGSYTGTGSAGLEVDLGFEPQWILIKGATSGAAYDWYLVDNMRGITTGGTDPLLWPNKTDAEDTLSNIISVTATGFKLEGTGWGFNRSSEDYIYIAIRRPMKTPESGTEVFSVDNRGGTTPALQSSFPVDAAIIADTSGAWSNSPSMGSRLTGTGRLSTSNTNAEASDSFNAWDYMDGWGNDSGTYTQYYSWMFKRATGFFDVVAYTGDGVAGSTQAHNLGVAPELIIIKQRNASGEDWKTGVNFTSTNNQERALNQPDSLITLDYTSYGVFNGQPTEANITLNSSTAVNASGSTYIAYLFASVAGVSKVGSYTGTGNSLDIDCGFANGARFVMIKRTDSSSDWWVWDTARGIVAGNDPTLRLNSTAAETTTADYIDPLSSGFTLTTAGNWLYGMNYPTGNYIFLAIA